MKITKDERIEKLREALGISVHQNRKLKNMLLKIEDWVMDHTNTDEDTIKGSASGINKLLEW